MPTVEKHIDPLTRDELMTLLATEASPRVSVYLPTEREWNKSKRNPTRLKNLIGTTEKQLAERGFKEAKREELLGPIRNLLDGHGQYWQHQSDGLALFAAPDMFETYRLPIDFEERAIVGGPFHVRPLLSFLADARFYILTLTQHSVHLYRATPHALDEVELTDVPTSLAEVMGEFDFEDQVSFHTRSRPSQGGQRDAMFFGRGDAGDKAQIKKRLDDFLRRLDNGVRKVVDSDATPAPLVLSGASYLRGLYRDVNQYQYLLDDGVDGNPDDLSAAELHERAWTVVRPQFETEREQAVDDYYQLSSSDPDRAPSSVEDVVPAAYFERVDTLFVPVGMHTWGTFNPNQNEVVIDGENDAANVDLLDLAVEHTLRNSGTVYVMDEGHMPDHAPVAAILRY